MSIELARIGNGGLLEEEHKLQGNPEGAPSDFLTRVTEAVKVALGNLALDIEACNKEFGQPIDYIVPLISTDIIKFFEKGDKSICLGGLEQGGEAGKKWKYVVEIDCDQKIKELIIGRLQTSGGCSRAYYSFDGKVILVPKNKEEKAIAQMQNAYLHTHHLENVFANLDESSAKHINELIQFLELPGSFSEVKEKLSKSLPFKNKILKGSTEAFTIAPLANPVEEIFKFAPTTKEQIIERIKILRDIAVIVAFCHAVGFIHSDLKPQNMLVYEGIGRIHDVGGAFTIPEEISVEAIQDKIKNLITSADYSHYQDGQAFKSLANEAQADSALKMIQVLFARDVFSLGISVIEALNGLNNLDGSMKEPFQAYAYVQLDDDHLVINGDDSSHKPVTCIKELIGDESIDAKIQDLLDQALKCDFSHRCSSRRLAKKLDDVYKELISLK